jgi:hypothetical protein
MIRMEIRNFKKFEKQLNYLKENFPKELEQFLIDVSKSLDKAVTKRSPVLTGDLKGSWKITKIAREGDKMYITIYNDATTEYEGRQVPLAPFVEFGHKIVDTEGNVHGKVDGFYMLTASIKAINRQIPRRLRKLFDRLVEGL